MENLSMLYNLARFTCLSLIVACALGCGPDGEPTYPVKGKVTYKGKPLTSGTVMFAPLTGPPAIGLINEQGNYELGTYRDRDGAVPGPHKVAIVCLDDTGDALPEKASGTPEPKIPAKYISAETSGLKADVAKSPNQFDFDL
jgi:hypothetical protein